MQAPRHSFAPPRFQPLPWILLAIFATGTALAQGTARKRPLDHQDYARWSSLEEPAISSQGVWASYELKPGDDGDGHLEVRSTDGQREHRIERCAEARITWDERWLACLQQPPRDERRAAELEGKKKEQQPKSALALLDLESGELELVAGVESYALPEKAGGFVAWLHHEGKGLDEGEGDDESEESPESTESSEGEPPTRPESETSVEKSPEQVTEKSAVEKAAERREDKKKERLKEGKVMVVRNLATGVEQRFQQVTDYRLSDSGTWLAFFTGRKQSDDPKDESDTGSAEQTTPSDSTEDSADEALGGAHLVRTAALPEARPLELFAGTGEYAQLAFDDDSRQLAFLSNAADWQSETPSWSLYRWREGEPQAAVAVGPEAEGLPKGWGPSQHQKPDFSDSGQRLYFGSAPLPRPDQPEITEDQKVVVDVWSWTDELIQPQQLVQREEEEKRTYQAVLAHGASGEPRLIQLASLTVPDVAVSESGDTGFVLGSSTLPYRRMISWDNQVYRDLYAIDPASGRERRVVTERRGNPRLSPDGRYAWWWDPEAKAWFTLDLEAALRDDAGGNADPVDVSSAIPTRLDNELHDSPSLPRSYGAAGWLEGDAGLLLYDRYDVWLIDPEKPGSPLSVTGGRGREERLRYRLVDLDPEEESIDPDRPLLLSSFDEETKDAGFRRVSLSSPGQPETLLEAAASFSNPIPAPESDRLLFRRGRFDEFDDLWSSDSTFASPVQLSDANPQQSEYLWGSAELVHWTSLDGEELDGILYKPENFDPSKKYPLLTYFYERTSDNLHNYATPIPHRSIVRFSFYTSRGYLVFAPDIPYRIGHPGPSAYSAIVPGVLKLIDQGFVDRDAIGVQGHSWGGYQTAYLITQTDLFSAAVAGAVVSNMTSAYGGIRWRSGMSRMFQYEKTQSRIGATLWDELHGYLDNSPLFFADRVETPLLMMHNDQDGAVPWYQGIELFTALRRLSKPVWMLNYNGQPHWVVTKANQIDYATRMQQFFDHYLKGASAPRWMIEGVPAIDKGRTLGLELVDPSEPAPETTRPTTLPSGVDGTPGSEAGD